MLKFRKDFNAKIVAALVAVVFFFNSTVYGIDLPNKTHLRVYSSFKDPEKADRLRRSLLELSNEAVGEVIREDLETSVIGIPFPEGATAEQKEEIRKQRRVKVEGLPKVDGSRFDLEGEFRVIPIFDLLKRTAHMAHIGLSDSYGETVIYLDMDLYSAFFVTRLSSELTVKLTSPLEWLDLSSELEHPAELRENLSRAHKLTDLSRQIPKGKEALEASVLASYPERDKAEVGSLFQEFDLDSQNGRHIARMLHRFRSQEERNFARAYIEFFDRGKAFAILGTDFAIPKEGPTVQLFWTIAPFLFSNLKRTLRIDDETALYFTLASIQYYSSERHDKYISEGAYYGWIGRGIYGMEGFLDRSRIPHDDSLFFLMAYHEQGKIMKSI